MFKVSILPDDVVVEVKAGTSLLEAAAFVDIELMHSCGGIGACTSCRVLVREGNEHLSSIGVAEEEQLTESGILQTHRLACQARVLGDVAFERPVWRSLRNLSTQED